RICASRLSSGDLIGAVAPPRGFYSYVMAASSTYYGGPICVEFLGAKGYAGFRFVGGDGELHYGWLRLAVTEQADVATVAAYAYEATPDTPITAGDRSDALLDGTVNRTDFPAAGGTLAYTFTATNATDAPLPLDLWIDADGPAALTRRLGSGTLPPGASVTRRVRVRVPAGAPAGSYEVKFKLGEYDTRRFITFERFAITKLVGAGAASSAEAFAAEPVEGDLFGGAEAAVTGTHALSAPSPNPSAGQAQLTLSVAEAQGVTVAVYHGLGRRVAVLHDGPMAAGVAHRLAFDGSGLPAGVYAVRAVGETFSAVRTLTLTH